MSGSFLIDNTWVAIAENEVAKADAYVVKIANIAASIKPTPIDPQFPTSPSVPPIQVPSMPAMRDVVWQLPNMPAAFNGSINIDGLLPDAFDSSPPSLNFGSTPAAFSEPLPNAPAINTNFAEPSLSVSLPAPPNLLSISTSNFNGLNFPTLDYNVPEMSLVAPQVREYLPGSLYTSSLLSTAKSTLERYIRDGGTALPPAVEEALWNRAREREYRQAGDAIADLDKMEVLGYAFPPGVYLNARVKINTELSYVASTLSREIAIEQAKLEQENIKWAMENAIKLEAELIQYTNQTEQRAFESVKYATEAGVALYNARVQAYTAYLDAYKLKVAIYEAQIRGEMARVDAYKAEIAAEQTKAEINNALVQQYKTQADVALANVEIYKAEIAGIQAKAQIEQLKIQIFGEQVKAYGTKVNAYTAGIEGFRASIQAEGAKQEAFKSQVQAYSAQVDAAAKIADAKIEEYKGLLSAKQTEWEGYKAAVQAQTSKAQAISAVNQTTAEAYKAETNAVMSYNEVLTKQWQATVEQAQRVAEIGIAAAKANSESYISSRSIAVEAVKAGAQVSAQIGAAALNSANWNYSSGLSENWSHSDSVSQSNSTSYSSSDSRSTSQSYSNSTSSSNNYNQSTSNSYSSSTSQSYSNSYAEQISNSTSNNTSNSTSMATAYQNMISDSTSLSKNYNYNQSESFNANV